MSVTHSIEEYIQQQLSSGRFKTRDELMREAVRIMQARELAITEVAEELRGPVERLKAGDPGLEINMDDIKREGRKRLAKTNGNG